MDNYFIGDVKFIWTEFECPNCGFRIKVKDMKKIENDNRKREANYRMPRAIKYLYNANPFYVYFKKHFCPKCNGRLKTKYHKKVVNSSSPEAKDYDFKVGDVLYIGDVEFRTMLFYCPVCGFEISFKDMKNVEKKRNDS